MFSLGHARINFLCKLPVSKDDELNPKRNEVTSRATMFPIHGVNPEKNPNPRQ